MSIQSRLEEELVDQYPHRTLNSLENHIDADEILERYLKYQDIDEYKHLDSEFPYQAALGRTADSEGYLILKTQFTYPDAEGVSKDHVKASLTVDNIDRILEENIVDENRILDGAGAELLESRKAAVNGEDLRPQTVHCLVFYDRPVVSATEETEFESQVHRSAAMQSVNEPSLATALIHAGKSSEGEELTGVQIDYWTRTIDGVENEGIDYTELDWEKPADL